MGGGRVRFAEEGIGLIAHFVDLGGAFEVAREGRGWGGVVFRGEGEEGSVEGVEGCELGGDGGEGGGREGFGRGVDLDGEEVECFVHDSKIRRGSSSVVVFYPAFVVWLCALDLLRSLGSL